MLSVGTIAVCEATEGEIKVGKNAPVTVFGSPDSPFYGQVVSDDGSTVVLTPCPDILHEGNPAVTITVLYSNQAGTFEPVC